MRTNQKMIVMVLVSLLLLYGNACADLSGDVKYEQNGRITISVSGLYAEKPYAIIVTRGNVPSLNSSDLLFLDEINSTGSGTLSLAFINVDIPVGTVFLGGEFMNNASPWRIGTLLPETNTNTTTFPESLTTIEEEAFQNTDFTHVYVGENVTKIEDRAFLNCKNLQAIHIPINVVDIGVDVFKGCPNVTIICKEGSTAEQYAETNNILYITE